MTESGLARQWYVACRSSQLRGRPLARTVLDVPLALFRTATGPAAVLDRCPHRNLALSLGRCSAGTLECRYHGWTFDGAGRCVRIPGLPDGQELGARHNTTAFAALEHQGWIWVCPTAGFTPPPPTVSWPVGSGYSQIYRSMELSASVPAALENTLDVPHTAFVHRGLLRSQRQQPIAVNVTVRPCAGGAEAVFEGEPRPGGAIGRLLAPRGAVVEHVDRFLLPSIAQVEYRLDQQHVVITSCFTPIGAGRTALHAVASFHTRVPAAVVRALVAPVAEVVLRQDARVLRQQSDNIARFGGAHPVNTRIDVLAGAIARLRHQLDRGEAPVAESEQQLVLYT
ncbi:MAG: Iron-sulfur cluster-binding protein Rieske family [Acidimicrobiia bacterium]|nr:Iron-sulfur cluster-binding protein Rieske family [Acidimicrobiia bacterium]